MSKKTDPAVQAHVRVRRLLWLEQCGPVMSELERRRVDCALVKAERGYQAAKPTTLHGALCHLFYLMRWRREEEQSALEWVGEYRRQMAGGRANVIEQYEAARFACLDEVPTAAPLILRAARMLSCGKNGALPMLREALAIVRSAPLPNDHSAAERHLFLALEFLTTPRAV